VTLRFGLSLVMLAYNAATSIADLVRALERLPIAGGHEIVLVDDGSADDSRAICRALFDKTSVPITIVSLARNYGEHNAVLAGVRFAAGGHIITKGDDFQKPPGGGARPLAFSPHNPDQSRSTDLPAKRAP